MYSLPSTSHKREPLPFSKHTLNRPYVLAIYSLSCCSKSIVLLITSSKRTALPTSFYMKSNDGNKRLPSPYLLYYFTNIVPRPSSVNSSIRMACGISPLMINTFWAPDLMASKQQSTLGIIPPAIIPSAFN